MVTLEHIMIGEFYRMNNGNACKVTAINDKTGKVTVQLYPEAMVREVQPSELSYQLMGLWWI